MRVTRSFQSMNIVSGPSESKLLEALVDYHNSDSPWFGGARVELEFTLEGDNGETYTVSTRLTRTLRSLPSFHSDEPVGGYSFQVFLDQDRVNVEYYLPNEFGIRGTFKDHDGPATRILSDDVVRHVPDFSKRN